MPKQIIDRIGFRQGVKASLDPSAVPPDALWEARNVRIDESGILRTRRGVEVFTQSLGLGATQGAASAFGDIIAAWNRNLYRFDSNGIPTTLAEGVIGAQASDQAEFLRWSRAGSEIVYILAGNGLWETDGMTVSLVTPYAPEAGERPNLLRDPETGEQDLESGPAKSRFGVIRATIGQRMAIAGASNAPNEVYLSEVLDATYWPDDQVIKLPDDGGRIVWLTNWYGALVIFRDRDIWAFFGADMSDPEKALILQVSSVGCVAGRTVASVPGVGVAFLGPDNVYGLQGVSGIEKQAQAVPIGDDIKKHLPGDRRGVCAVYYDREYRLSFPASREMDRVFRLTMKHLTGWFIDSGPRTAMFVVHDETLYSADWQRGQLHKFTGALADAGEPLRFYAAFRREALQPGPVRIKRLLLYTVSKWTRDVGSVAYYGPVYGLGLYGEGHSETVEVLTGTEQTLDVRLAVDGIEFSVKNFRCVVKRAPEVVRLAGHEPVVVLEARFHPSLHGHFAQVRISAEEPYEDITILGYALEFVPRRIIRGKEVVI